MQRLIKLTGPRAVPRDSVEDNCSQDSGRTLKRDSSRTVGECTGCPRQGRRLSASLCGERKNTVITSLLDAVLISRGEKEARDASH